MKIIKLAGLVLLTTTATSFTALAQNLEVEGKVHVTEMELDNTADSIVVNINNGTLGVRELSSILDASPKAPNLTGTLALGGSPTALSISGRLVYVTAQGTNTMKIIDVFDPSNPVEISSTAIEPLVQDIKVIGRYAYVLNAGFGTTRLEIIDVSDPSNPEILGNTSAGVSARRLEIVGCYAYVTDLSGNKLLIIDVSNPDNPMQVSSLSIPDDPFRIDISGDIAYVHNSQVPTSRITVVDISDPRSPSIIGNVDTGAPIITTIAARGNKLYLLGGLSSELIVMDVSDPANPVIAGSVGLNTNITFPLTMSVSGRYAHVLANTGEYSVVDLIDSANPTVVLEEASVVSDVFNSSLSGGLIYTINSGTSELNIIDITGAEMPTLSAHSLWAGAIHADNTITTQGNIEASEGITAGSGGIYSQGNVGIDGSVKIDSVTLHIDAGNDRIGFGIGEPLSRYHFITDGSEQVLMQSSNTTNAMFNFINNSYFGFLEVPDTSNILSYADGFDFDFGNNSLEPYNDNTTSLGNASYKWTEVWATNGMIQTSDRHMKEDVKRLAYGLDAVMQLNPVSYRWKGHEGSESNLGFMAQEVQKVIPEVVVQAYEESTPAREKLEGVTQVNNPTAYGMKYAELIPVLTRAIQEQQQEIESYKKRLEELEALVTKLVEEK